MRPTVFVGVVTWVASGRVGLQSVSVNRQELILRQRTDGGDDGVIVATMWANETPFVRNVSFVRIEGDSRWACHHCIGRNFATPLKNVFGLRTEQQDRKSTRLNSSHLGISYAVF